MQLSPPELFLPAMARCAGLLMLVRPLFLDVWMCPMHVPRSSQLRMWDLLCTISCAVVTLTCCCRCMIRLGLAKPVEA